MRTYRKPGGSIDYPSVTTILNATKGGDRQLRLINALQKPGGLKRREMSRQRGNELDKLVKNYLLGEPMTVCSQEYMAYFRKLQPTLDLMRQQSDAIMCDRIVYHDELLYAGTTDIVLIHNGQAIVIDLKTAASAQMFSYGREDAWLQVAAYGMALALELPVIGLGILLSTRNQGGLECCMELTEMESLKQEWLNRVQLYHGCSSSVSSDGASAYGNEVMEDLML